MNSSCSPMEAQRWFMSFCRITFLFSTSRIIMLLEYSRSMPAVLLTTIVPMVMMLCTNMIPIKGIRNILKIVVFFFL